MKKILIIVGVAVLVLIIGGVLAVSLMLDGAIKKGVETVGPMLTKVDVKLDSASLSILSGSGKLKGLVVGNPEGYKSPSAISVGLASLVVSPGSVFSDKLVVKSINVQAPQITFETDLKGNNLSKILANIEAATGGSGGEKKPESTSGKASKKIQVDEFVISGGKINVSVTTPIAKTVTVPLPEIKLDSLGQGPEGITVAELSKRVMKPLLEEAIKAASNEAMKMGKDAALDKATKGLGDLLKKK